MTDNTVTPSAEPIQNKDVIYCDECGSTLMSQDVVCECQTLSTPEDIDGLLEHLMENAMEEDYTRRVNSLAIVYRGLTSALYNLIDATDKPNDTILNLPISNEFETWLMDSYNDWSVKQS